jgi:hypothetical protein
MCKQVRLYLAKAASRMMWNAASAIFGVRRVVDGLYLLAVDEVVAYLSQEDAVGADLRPDAVLGNGFAHEGRLMGPSRWSFFFWFPA